MTNGVTTLACPRQMHITKEMRKLLNSIIETLIQKRFSYIDLVVIAVIEYLILTIR